MRRNEDRRRGVRGDESRRESNKYAHCTASATQELGNETCKKRDVYY